MQGAHQLTVVMRFCVQVKVAAEGCQLQSHLDDIIEESGGKSHPVVGNMFLKVI